jgi:hypothetical protein
MSKLPEIAAALMKLAYEHDPMLLHRHEQAAKEKFVQLDSYNSHSEQLRKTYHDKIKELKDKGADLTPEDFESLLNIFNGSEKEAE